MREKHSFRFSSSKAGEGVSAHVLSTRKFKTTSICLLMGRDLDERASHAALMGEVLKRGSAEFPNMRAIAEEMEEMYGASFGCGVSRIGGKQALAMRITLPNENYLPVRARLLEKGFDFVEEMLLRPRMVDGAFDPEIVKREKANLIARIDSLINDKMEFAQRRCVEEMCRTERFRFFELGDSTTVAGLAPRALFAFYAEFLTARPVDVFVVGDVDEKKVVERVRRMFRGRKPGDYSFTQPEPEPKPRKPRRITEAQEVEQAKLCMGLRSHTTARDADYPAAVMYNGLLGGFSHSRLFRAVRGEEGLAYDAHSYIENSRGLIIVGVGVEKRNLRKALGVVEEQMAELRAGKITRDEMAKTRKSVLTRLGSAVDSPMQLMHMHYSQMVNGVDVSLDEWKKRMSAVSAADVTAMARKVAVDTIYALVPRDGKAKR